MVDSLLLDCTFHFKSDAVVVCCCLVSNFWMRDALITLDTHFVLMICFLDIVPECSADDGHLCCVHLLSANANAMTTFPIREIVAMSMIVVVKIVYFVCSLCRSDR